MPQIDFPATPTTQMIVAIESEIDSQLRASGIYPAEMYRQDGHYVYAAMLSAISPASKQGEA